MENLSSPFARRGSDLARMATRIDWARELTEALGTSERTRRHPPLGVTVIPSRYRRRSPLNNRSPENSAPVPSTPTAHAWYHLPATKSQFTRNQRSQARLGPSDADHEGGQS